MNLAVVCLCLASHVVTFASAGFPFPNHLDMASTKHDELNHGLRRRRRLATTVSGTCTFFNSFTSTTTCVEFRGNWTSTFMQTACQQLTGTLQEASSSTQTDLSCPIPSNLAGYCLVAQFGLEAASPLPGACDSNRNVCVSSLNGTWEPSSACGGTASNTTTTDDDYATNNDDESSTGGNVTGAFPDFDESTGQDDSSGASRLGMLSKLRTGALLASLIMLAV